MLRPIDINCFIINRFGYLAVFGVFLMIPVFALADSAAAWKAYQESKNPLVELGLLVIGIVVFFSLLVWLNNLLEKRKKASKKIKK